MTKITRAIIEQAIHESSEYRKGVEACSTGASCPEGASEQFISGYSSRYAQEQMETKSEHN